MTYRARTLVSKPSALVPRGDLVWGCHEGSGCTRWPAFRSADQVWASLCVYSVTFLRSSSRLIQTLLCTCWLTAVPGTASPLTHTSCPVACSKCFGCLRLLCRPASLVKRRCPEHPYCHLHALFQPISQHMRLCTVPLDAADPAAHGRAIQIVTLITHMQVCNILNGNQGFLSEPAVPPTPVRSLRDLLVRHSMQLYTVSSMDDRERRVCQSFACQCWNQCTTSRKDAASADTTVESSFPAMCRSSHVCSAHCSSGWMWPTLHQAGSSQMRFSG